MYPYFLLASSIMAASILGAPAPARIQSRESNSTADNQDLINQLELAATAVDRLALLPNNDDHLFDFRNPAGTGSTITGDGSQPLPS